MKSYEQLAASAYAAFIKHSQRLSNLEGVAVLTWEELPEINRQCWIEATKQVVAEAALVH